ncbi:hypothetical protein ONZ43_g6613 [Nemania bipapillata]|uniref:Uncharacterized protein n=1 Tax=Nemania bipapillata TaxID=110536 RepID=A0ACC2HXU1_9PEZI|nr:hypothetical protein ONZ43_g6613 [Nemania bipapillata]
MASSDGRESLSRTFTLGDSDIVRAEKDKNLYWSAVYRELSHVDLFKRASNTRRRLIPDIEGLFHEVSKLKNRGLFHGTKSSDPEPHERLKLRLAGRAQAGTNQVVMTDSVWIQCSDESSAKKIKAGLDKIEWLKSSEYAPVYVYLEARGKC